MLSSAPSGRRKSCKRGRLRARRARTGSDMAGECSSCTTFEPGQIYAWARAPAQCALGCLGFFWTQCSAAGAATENWKWGGGVKNCGAAGAAKISENVAPQTPPDLAISLQRTHSPQRHSGHQPSVALDTRPGPTFDGSNCWWADIYLNRK
eukprot:gene11742-biopygen9440